MSLDDYKGIDGGLDIRQDSSTRGSRKYTSLELYFKDIGDRVYLSRGDEKRLAEAISAGDPNARKELAEANLRFVISVARKYQNNGVPLEDLISEGNVGLMIALDRFDETRGYKFISYAVWWIKQAIRSYISEDRNVKLPANVIEDLSKIYRVQKELKQIIGETPSPEEVADAVGMSIEKVNHILTSNMSISSLDYVLHGNEKDDASLMDILPDENAEMADLEMVDQDMRENVRKTVDSLGKRDAEVIRLYFGLNGDPLTLEEIGERFNLTRERIRQIKERALRNLRHPSRRKTLEVYDPNK